MAGILGEFEPMSPTEKFEPSYVTISSKALKFNVDTEEALNFPGHIKLFLNRKGKQLAIQAASADDEDAVPFYTQDGRKARFIAVKAPAILKVLTNFLALEEGEEHYSVRAKGMIYPDEKVIIYNLEDGERAIVKPRGRRKAGASTADDDDIF